MRISSVVKYLQVFTVVILILSFSTEYTTHSKNSQLEYPLFSSALANSLQFNASNAYAHISSQLDFGFRVPGTANHSACADWIANQIYLSVDELLLHNFTIQKEEQPSYDCQNILGKLNTEKNNIVILASHWDSRNVAEKDTEDQNLPIPGANDGASGVGVLLELSRVLNLYKDFLDCEVWFLFLDAEDQGSSRGIYGLEGWDWAEGAKAFSEDIEDFKNDNEDVDCFILLDMVGGTYLEFIKESRSDTNLHEAIFEIGKDLGYSSAFPDNPTKMSIVDDHVYFDVIGIPVIDLIIDFINGDWIFHHTHEDNLDNIDIASLNITGRTIEEFFNQYYTVGDGKTWNDGDDLSTLNIIIISATVVIGVFVLNFVLRKRKR